MKKKYAHRLPNASWKLVHTYKKQVNTITNDLYFRNQGMKQLDNQSLQDGPILLESSLCYGM